eukprot:7377891-Prymnesium_polylepis.1
MQTRLPGTGSKAQICTLSLSGSKLASRFARMKAAMPPRESPSTTTETCLRVSRSMRTRDTTSAHWVLSPTVHIVPGRPYATPQPSKPILKARIAVGGVAISVMSRCSHASKKSPICVVVGCSWLDVPSKKT